MDAQHNETAEQENPELRGPRQQRGRGPRISKLVATIAVGAVLAASAFTPAAAQPPRASQHGDQQHSDQDRARIIRECMEMNGKFNTDPYGRTGGVEHMYQACMANHGLPG